MEPITIICVSGRLLNDKGETVSTSRVGKDTVCMALGLFHDFARLAMSDSIQTCLGVDLNTNGIEILKILEQKGITWRPALKEAGTECRVKARVFDVWRSMVRVKVAILYELAGIRRFAISGVRYPEELADMKVMAGLFGGRMVHAEILRRADPGAKPSEHSSDRKMEGVRPDHILRNVGTKRELVHLADSFGEMVLGGCFDSKELPRLKPAVPEQADDIPF